MKRVTITRTFALATMLLLYAASFAQQPQYIWGRGITAGNTGSAYHVAMDKAPDIARLVQVGRFTDTLQSGANRLYGGGMYINYTDTNGTVIWTKKEGLNYPPNIFGYSCPAPLDVEILPSGDIVVLGTLCADSANIINGSPVNGNGYFIVKYNSAGTFQWLKTYGAKAGTYLSGNIEASMYTGGANPNYIYLALAYADTIELDTDTLLGASTTANTAIIALDAFGTERWAANLPATVTAIPKDLLCVNNQQLYALVDIVTTVPIVGQQKASFITRINPLNGNIVYQKSISNNMLPMGQTFEATALDLLYFPLRIATVGRFSGTVDIGPNTLTAATGGNEVDIWVAVMDTFNGPSSFHWSRSITSPGQDYATDICIHGNMDEITISGLMGIGGSGSNFAGAPLIGGGVIASYDYNGNELWALQQISGYTANIQTIKPSNSLGGNLFVSGGIMFEAIFGTNHITNAAIFNNTVSQVSFLAKTGPATICGQGFAEILGADTLIACQAPLQLSSVYTIVGPANPTPFWTPSYLFDDPTTFNPTINGSVNMETVVVTMTNQQNGCIYTDSVVVGVYLSHFDTLYTCQGSSVTLDLGPGATSYQWNSGPSSSQTMIIDTPGQFIGVAFYQTPPVTCGALTSLFTVLDSCFTQPDSVWPGDANADGVANLYDVLNIGIGYNISGPVRSNASLVWVGQAAQDWNLAFLNGTNLKHADCDGDGLIDSLDVDVVALNYGLTHAKTGGSQRRPGSPPISLSFTVDTVQAPNLVTADISLGDASLPVTDGYGVAFSLIFDNTLVDSSSIQTDFTDSWLGIGGSPQSLTKNLFSQGQLDIAHTRTTHASVSGQGKICTVSFYIQDNIIGKDLAAYNFGLDVTGSLLISDDETEIPLDEKGDTVLVLDEFVGVSELAKLDVNVHPNPATGLFYLSLPQHSGLASISIVNVLGEEVYSGKINGSAMDYPIDLSNKAAGIYLLKVQAEQGASVIRLVKQ